MSTPERWAWAEVDLDALAHNVGVVAAAAAPATVWAVVKADGYGHGAAIVAERALEAGAGGLCVALAAEALELRDAGITAPILVLSQQPGDWLRPLIEAGVAITAYTAEHVDDVAGAARAVGRAVEVHVKVDTGMHRVGADPGSVRSLVERVNSHAPALQLSGLYTHLACADQPDAAANAHQLAGFRAVLDDVRAAGGEMPVLHAANSAGALALADARFDLVRAGIAIYGISPGPGVDHLTADLRPVMSLRARVSLVKRVPAGDHVSYGWRHQFASDTVVATVPIGYADGVSRRLGTMPDRPGADVLIGGRRHPIVGVVTMDQLMVDVGEAGSVAVGDEVVLIGRQGEHLIRAEDWAERLGTIGYEIVCGISSRVPRVHRSGRPPTGVS
jgi:alanine racemase